MRDCNLDPRERTRMDYKFRLSTAMGKSKKSNISAKLIVMVTVRPNTQLCFTFTVPTYKSQGISVASAFSMKIWLLSVTNLIFVK